MFEPKSENLAFSIFADYIVCIVLFIFIVPLVYGTNQLIAGNHIGAVILLVIIGSIEYALLLQLHKRGRVRIWLSAPLLLVAVLSISFAM